jgi:hypothetical protein
MSTADNAPLNDGDAQYLEVSPDGDARDNKTRQGDADAEAIERGKETWNTSLPQGIRESMRSGRRTQLPKAYEDRLKRYFEGLE